METKLTRLDLNIVKEWLGDYESLSENIILTKGSTEVLNRLLMLYRSPFDRKLNKFRSKRKSNMYKLMR
jgi:hypothetical protein